MAVRGGGGQWTVRGDWRASPLRGHLVELLQAAKALQHLPVLPLPVLPADEGGALLLRSAAVDFLLRGKIGGPEAVGILVACLQEELRETGEEDKYG